MSYIDKEKLIKADIASIENRVRHAFNQGYDLGFKDGKASSRTSSTTKNDLEVLRDTLVGRAILVGFKQGVDSIRAMTSVTPQEPRCKECKWWKDSDGEYRRGVNAESQCPINRREVFEGNGYCYIYEPQKSEDKE